MTRQELLALFERYLKRNDLQDLYSDFLMMAEARINTVMRLLEMEKVNQFTPTTALYSLPGDCLELRHVNATLSRGPVSLVYVTPDQARWKKAQLGGGGGYTYYTIMDKQIEIIPHPGEESQTEVEIYYYAAPLPLVNPGDTNDVIGAYPNLYAYAMLIEAALYRESQPLVTHWTGAFDAYAKQLNDKAWSARIGGGESIRMEAI